MRVGGGMKKYTFNRIKKNFYMSKIILTEVNRNEKVIDDKNHMI